MGVPLRTAGFYTNAPVPSIQDQVFAYQCQVSSQNHVGIPKLDTSGIFQTAVVEFFINK